MSAIRRVSQGVVYSNRRKASSQIGMGKVWTFFAIVISSVALVIAPAFFISIFILGREEPPQVLISAAAVPIVKPVHNVAEVLNAYAKLATQRAFRAIVITKHKTRPTTESRFEYVAPDRFHGLFDSIEFFVLGRTMYVKYNGNWVKSIPDPPLNMCFIDPKVLEKNYRSAVDPQYNNDELIDGISTSVFQYQLNCSDTKEIIRVWLRQTDGLPHRLESNALNDMSTTVIYYDFNANITITPPIP